MSIFSNDKSTKKDELVIAIFILLIGVAGVLLVIFTPEFWIIDAASSQMFGVLCVITSVVLIPSLIYRLATNNIETKGKSE